MAKNIVIIGGSHAGVSTAQRLLKSASTPTAIKVTLITPNSHMYWNLASPRGLIPGNYEKDELFLEIKSGFKQYSSDRFEIVLGTAVGLDEASQTVTVRCAEKEKSVAYDMLVLASGSRTLDSSPFKNIGTTEETRSALKDLQARVEAAKSITVAGAGVTGVEVAGELGSAFGKEKKIILLAPGPRVLEDMLEVNSDIATKELQRLGVEVQLRSRVKESVIGSNGQYEIILSSGTTITTDLYIPTFGLAPNSSYVPAKFLTSQGFIKVDEFLQVTGTKNIWAIGDVSDLEQSQWIKAEYQSAHLAKNLIKILQNQAPQAYKKSTTPMMGLSVGKDMGTGHYGNWRIPTFVARYLRKTLFLEKLTEIVTGTAF
ncbi:unnamed protein product [Clonostachys rosea f. rosea IK726]|uniref:FAD/NAD(P)-binding domain-containing protein n=2 Tax=Bionectria ochroleuca TaxID=29856 RepID=A0A0B7KII4_BIOOC|nr:unnamed protein product [Clonostachys rosea f. rosea IK726]